MKSNIVIFAVLLALVAISSSTIADSSFPIGANPGNTKTRNYLLTKYFDIGLDNITGGQTATPNPTELRSGSYAFMGEQIIEKVLVRDIDGAADISSSGTKITLNNSEIATCAELTVSSQNSTHVITTDGETLDITQIPAWGSAPAGYNKSFDKIFKCVITVKSSWFGLYKININSTDSSGTTNTDGISQWWFFNPEISVDLSTNDGSSSVIFYDGSAGQTVYSKNKLVIENQNLGQSIGVDVWAWISSDDLTSPVGGICPISNVLDTDQNMEYRGNKGTFFGTWQMISNPNPADGCSVFGTCSGAKGIITPGVPDDNRINNGHHAEIQFRLSYPSPCVGNYNQGNLHVVVRAI